MLNNSVFQKIYLNWGSPESDLYVDIILYEVPKVLFERRAQLQVVGRYCPYPLALNITISLSPISVAAQGSEQERLVAILMVPSWPKTGMVPRSGSSVSATASLPSSDSRPPHPGIRSHDSPNLSSLHLKAWLRDGSLQAVLIISRKPITRKTYQQKWKHF